jgi:hypothetical protein
MGKSWDGTGAVHTSRLWKVALRALKPGGHALVWALPRTSHHTALALENAGFEIRDVHHDIVAGDTLLQQFVEALDGAQRAALERLLASQAPSIFYQIFGTGFPKSLTSKSADIPEGAGTAKKPAVEHWILARKPLDGSIADTCAKWGTGVLNIDACRIGTGNKLVRPAIPQSRSEPGGFGLGAGTQIEPGGRWPAHLSLQHAPGCEPVGETTETVAKFENVAPPDRDGNGTNFAMGVQREAGKTELARVVYRCAPGCPVAELDAQSGTRKSGGGGKRTTSLGIMNDDGWKPTVSKIKRPPQDTGGASRFFFNAVPFAYIGKASRREKDKGLAHLRPSTGGEATGREDGSAGTGNPRAGAGRTGGARNVHPTCKSVALMKWLIRLITPDGGTVLDMFAGSGTTGVAALGLGMNFIGCDAGGDRGEYLPILVGRIRDELGLEPDLTIAQPELGTPVDTAAGEPDPITQMYRDMRDPAHPDYRAERYAEQDDSPDALEQ